MSDRLRQRTRMLIAQLRALVPEVRGRRDLADDRLFDVLGQATDEDLSLIATRVHARRAALQASAEAARAAEAARLAHQIYVGQREAPARWSHLGWRLRDGAGVALSREGGQVMVVAGTVGAGKSRALLALLEAALAPCPGLTSAALPPTAGIAFHTDLSGVTLPGLALAVATNTDPAERDLLHRNLGVAPRPLRPIRLLVHKDEVAATTAALRAALGADPETLGLSVRPLAVRLGQLGLRGIEALIGAPPQEVPTYQQALLSAAQELGPTLTVARLRAVLDAAPALTRHTRALAEARLDVLARIEDPDADLWDHVAPGTLTIIGLAGRWLRRRDVFPVIVALLNAVAQPSARHGALQRLIALDEINLLGQDPLLWEHLIATARLVRHSGSTLWLAGQDLFSVPDELLGLATQVLCFRLVSPQVVIDVRRRVSGLRGFTAAQLARLPPGHALWVPGDSTDPAWCGVAEPVLLRPSLAAHGGHTRAVL